MARPASPEISALEDALASLSYIPEALARYVRRSRHRLTTEDMADLWSIAKAAQRTKTHIGIARSLASRAYQKPESAHAVRDD